MGDVKLQGEQIVDEARRIIHDGNVRRVVVKQKGRSWPSSP